MGQRVTSDTWDHGRWSSNQNTIQSPEWGGLAHSSLFTQHLLSQLHAEWWLNVSGDICFVIYTLKALGFLNFYICTTPYAISRDSVDYDDATRTRNIENSTQYQCQCQNWGTLLIYLHKAACARNQRGLLWNLLPKNNYFCLKRSLVRQNGLITGLTIIFNNFVKVRVSSDWKFLV